MSKPENQTTSTIIAKAYNAFLDAKGVNARAGQKSMMNLCYRLVNGVETDSDGKRKGEPAVCVIEAGTGTGKTLAYSIPLIPLAQVKNKSLVISTATVALQEQVMFKDLPDIRSSAGLDFTFAMAKGRGRYYCKTRANREADREMVIYGHETETGSNLRNEFDDNLWDGDRDTYSIEIREDVWNRVNAVAGQCTGQSCPHYNSCPFFLARGELENADVIVANHDIVLSDLALGGGAVLPEPEHCVYVFDEGHHLTGKAINHFSTSSSLDITLKWIDDLSELVMPLVDSYNDDMEELISNLYSESETLRSELVSAKQFFLQSLPFIPEYDSRETCIFPAGMTPYEVRNHARGIIKTVQGMQRVQGKIEKIVDDMKSNDINEHKLITGELSNRLDTLINAWQDFISVERRDKNGIPFARWVVLHRGRTNDLIINTSPVHAGEMLKKNVWEKVYAAVITSATIRTLGSFSSYLDQAGLSDETPTMLAQSPFNYEENGVLFIPKMRFSPIQRDAEAHTQEVASILPKLVVKLRGCLVLFASKRQMTDVFDLMPEGIKSTILMQTTIPKSEIVSRHKVRIDEGKPSIIFGMASFAEGVDLPGDYCNNVIITKLPFMVPTDPVSQTLAGWMESVGRNTFEEISLPDACIKLVQAVGRLIRKETDKGAVTILDNRLVTKQYGPGILNSLPPFRRVIRHN